MTVCLLDTTIVTCLVRVPFFEQGSDDIERELEGKVRARETLLLPMTAILETGNHIGQHGDGGTRRKVATRFVKLVSSAIAGDLPFAPTKLFDSSSLQSWLEEFPDWVMRNDSKGKGSGLGDLSIKKDFEHQCILNPSRRVYVWSVDEHLRLLDRPPPWPIQG